MTVHVVTPEHGTQSFSEADGWETHLGNEDWLDEGSLWLPSKQDPDQAVAEFAKGAWLFVYEVSDLEPLPEPRVWDSIRDVPDGVRVANRDGDWFIKAAGELYYIPLREDDGTRRHWGNLGGPSFDKDWAPFTEVIA